MSAYCASGTSDIMRPLPFLVDISAETPERAPAPCGWTCAKVVRIGVFWGKLPQSHVYSSVSGGWTDGREGRWRRPSASDGMRVTAVDTGWRDEDGSYWSSCSGGGSEVARGKGTREGDSAGGEGVPVR